MGASDSKLAFKQGIFKLSEQKNIAPDDSYWASFWELPESAEDVFSLFSSTDIRRIRDESLGNLETLVLAVTSRLFALRNDPTFPNAESASEKDALNCVRVLTRLLPFLYEAENLDAWEETFFWGLRKKRTRNNVRPDVLFDGVEQPQRQAENEDFLEAKPLAEELIDTLIDLLFFTGFTLPGAPSHGSRVSLSIWMSGVGCTHPVTSSSEQENNRMEVLRLLLTLASKSMYITANVLPLQGVKAITYMATISEKQLVLTLLCSLLNTTLKYNATSWRVPYEHVVVKDPKQTYVTCCLQLLLALVQYPVPENGSGVPPKNNFRHFLGKLHRAQDFQFLVDGMTRILNQPLQATTSYLPGSQKSLSWCPEMIMLFWEVLQCNKRFRSFVVDTDRVHDFVVLILYHALQNRSDSAKQGLVRMCVFVLQTLSVESNFGNKLNKPFHAHDALPQSIRVPNFHGTYMDFLITSIHTLMTSSQGKLDAIYPALLAIINNVAPFVNDLSTGSSSRLLQLFATMSSPTFLFANESNHTLLHSLLEALNAMVEHQDRKNPALLYAIVRSHKRFHALRDMVLDGGEAQLERQALLRKEQSETSDPNRGPVRPDLADTMQSPTSVSSPRLEDVPEERDAFAVGDDEDFDEEDPGKPVVATSTEQSTQPSRSGSVADSNEDLSLLPAQVRGMSEKARGKLPASRQNFSRQSSTASLASLAVLTPATRSVPFEPNAIWMNPWLSGLPLHTSLTLIDQLLPQIPAAGLNNATTAMRAIRGSELINIEPSPIRLHLFEWSPLSLGWYESLLWSFIFGTEMSLSKGAPGIWKGTNIKLFRVQEAASHGPSLLQPQGAVDAVGSTLIRRIGSLSLPSRGNNDSIQRTSTGGRIWDV